MRSIVNLFNEIGMLAKIPRSGFAFLGTGKQSVAEHSYRVALIAHALANLSSAVVDQHKLLMICLLHDLPEARIGDLNYVQKKYVKADVNKVLEELKQTPSLGPDIVSWIDEYEKGETLEAKIAHDADQLELMLMLKGEHELGNKRATDWLENALKRLKTPLAKEMANAILETPSDEWWIQDKNDPHWVDGDGLTIEK